MTFPDATSGAVPASPAERRHQAGWLWPAGGLVSLLAVVGVLSHFDPAVSPWFPPCFFHQWTGLHCPGCGSTRAMYQLLHGHVGAALRLNAFAVLALPFLGYWVAGEICRRTGRRFPVAPVPGVVARGLAAGVIAFWVLRNVPAWPFTWLAPG